MFYPAGGQQYTLGSSISSTQTTILLSSFTEPVTGTPYTMVLLNTDIAYGTIAPKTSQSEFISFTGITQNANGTATLTGVTRGLAKKYPFTTSGSYKLPHSGGSIFILSDVPQLFEKYISIENDVTVTGVKTFTNPDYPRMDTATPAPTDDEQLVPKKYVDDAVISGGVPATTSVLGIVKISVAAADPANPIATGTNDTRIPTQDENNALPGTSGSPSSTNKYVTQNDTTNAATITGTTISFTATSTISDSGNGFVTSGFQVGQTITVSGSGSNDGTYTITAVAAGAITVAETSIVNESAGASVTISAAVDGKVLRLNSSGELPNENNILGVGVDYQLFTANGTWTKPSWAKVVDVYVCGAGGGGGGGDNGNNSVGRLGGGGGGGGGISFKRFRASGLGSTETVTVGTGGTGGATTADGTDGGASSFGTTTLLKANGGSKGTGATGGAAGTGGAGGTATNGEIGIAGGAGGNGDGGLTPGHQGTDTATLFSARGGAGGGGRDTSANVAAGGTGGGFITNYVKAGGTAGATDTNGGAGQSSIGLIYGGTGGGGGGGSATTIPGNGGAGTNGSGGGGGGGGATGATGSGGNGGDGFIIVISY